MIKMASYKKLNREIQEAFSRKEKAETLLAKLEEMNTSIDEEQRLKLKTEYEGALSKANEDILNIKKQISEEIAILQDKQKTLKKDRDTLEARHKVGEIDEESYHKQERVITQEITKLSDEASKYNSLFIAQSAAEVGGTVDTTLNAENKTVSLPDLSSGLNVLKGLESPDLTAFHRFSGSEFAKMNKVAIIGTCFMVLSLFIPWVSSSYFGISESQGATFTDFVLCFAAIIAIVVKIPKANSLILTCVGGLVLLFDIYGIVTLKRGLDVMATNVGPGMSYGDSIGFNISLEAGFYLNLIGGLILICAGILRLKKEGLLISNK